MWGFIAEHWVTLCLLYIGVSLIVSILVGSMIARQYQELPSQGRSRDD